MIKIVEVETLDYSMPVNGEDKRLGTIEIDGSGSAIYWGTEDPYTSWTIPSDLIEMIKLQNKELNDTHNDLTMCEKQLEISKKELEICGKDMAKLQKELAECYDIDDDDPPPITPKDLLDLKKNFTFDQIVELREKGLL